MSEAEIKILLVSVAIMAAILVVESILKRLIIYYASRRENASKIAESPKFAEYLIYFILSKQDRVNLIGDLEEEYGEVLKKFGRKAASVWYYKQVFTSIRPVVWNRLVRWGAIAWIGDWIRRHI